MANLEKQNCSKMIEMNRPKKATMDPDLTITSGKRSFQVHRNVLTTYSSFFAERVNNGELLADDTMAFSDIPPKLFEVIFVWMYSRNIDLTDIDVIDICWAAKFLGISELEQLCKDYMSADADRAARFLAVCCSPHPQFGREDGIRLAAPIFNEIAKSELFPELEMDVVCALLSSDCLNVTREDEVLAAALRWLLSDWPLRSVSWPHIMAHVRLHLIEEQSVRKILANYEQTLLTAEQSDIEIVDHLISNMRNLNEKAGQTVKEPQRRGTVFTVATVSSQSAAEMVDRNPEEDEDREVEGSTVEAQCPTIAESSRSECDLSQESNEGLENPPRYKERTAMSSKENEPEPLEERLKRNCSFEGTLEEVEEEEETVETKEAFGTDNTKKSSGSSGKDIGVAREAKSTVERDFEGSSMTGGEVESGLGHAKGQYVDTEDYRLSMYSGIMSPEDRGKNIVNVSTVVIGDNSKILAETSLTKERDVVCHKATWTNKDTKEVKDTVSRKMKTKCDLDCASILICCVDVKCPTVKGCDDERLLALEVRVDPMMFNNGVNGSEKKVNVRMKCEGNQKKVVLIEDGSKNSRCSLRSELLAGEAFWRGSAASLPSVVQTRRYNVMKWLKNSQVVLKYPVKTKGRSRIPRFKTTVRGIGRCVSCTGEPGPWVTPRLCKQRRSPQVQIVKAVDKKATDGEKFTCGHEKFPGCAKKRVGGEKTGKNAEVSRRKPPEKAQKQVRWRL